MLTDVTSSFVVLVYSQYVIQYWIPRVLQAFFYSNLNLVVSLLIPRVESLGFVSI